MRQVRLIVLAATALLALGITAAATAMRPGPVEDGTLSLRDGRATVQLRMKGGILGRMGRGKVTVTEPVSDPGTVVIRGARARVVNARTTVYTGKSIRFRISADERFTVRINGTKINFSAVGRGDGWIDGWGNPDAGVYFDGSFSLNGDAYKSIPDLRTPIRLEAPPTEG
jgi:hypothetical protein